MLSNFPFKMLIKTDETKCSYKCTYNLPTQLPPVRSFTITIMYMAYINFSVKLQNRILEF